MWTERCKDLKEPGQSELMLVSFSNFGKLRLASAQQILVFFRFASSFVPRDVATQVHLTTGRRPAP